jgi:formate hydrogenlyase transcriptional activator
MKKPAHLSDYDRRPVTPGYFNTRDETSRRPGESEMVGTSAKLRNVQHQVGIVGATDSTVLLLGETGTGKGVVASLIHDVSPRHSQALVKVNCAAIPLGLLESELFGHERGAFTGAISQRIGRFELANKGTLFLDEIGDIPQELQPKLLRVLQEHEFERLGSTQTVHTNVRLIAATHRNLTRMVEEGKFRADLYYRLNVFPITIPPLRERREDIPLLVKHFVRMFSERMNRHVEVIPEETMDCLVRCAWPGNIRELENFIERAVILSFGAVLEAPLPDLVLTAEPATPLTTLKDVERAHIVNTLRETNGVIGAAAVRLGVPRSTLFYKMRRLGISVPRPARAHGPALAAVQPEPKSSFASAS